jgi:hypothetical protein
MSASLCAGQRSLLLYHDEQHLTAIWRTLGMSITPTSSAMCLSPAKKHKHGAGTSHIRVMPSGQQELLVKQALDNQLKALSATWSDVLSRRSSCTKWLHDCCN